MKNWNRLQNAANLGFFFFIDVKIAHVCRPIETPQTTPKHPKPPKTSPNHPNTPLNHPNRHQTTPNRHKTTPNHISLASPEIQVHLRPLPTPYTLSGPRQPQPLYSPFFASRQQFFHKCAVSCCQIIYKHLKLLTILLHCHCVGMVV